MIEPSVMETQPVRLRREAILVVACYLIVYVVWGSTYLAIKWALVSLPPS